MIYGFDFRRYNKLVALVLVFFGLSSEINSSVDADTQAVLIIGDSLVQGFGLLEENGFVSQLERKLNGEGANINLINGGVSGDTTAGGLARLEWSLTDDIKGVVVSLGANDMLRGISPVHSKNNLRQMLNKLEQRKLPVLLVGIRSIENYGAGYKTSFDKIYTDLAQEFKVILYPDLLSPLLNQEQNNQRNYFQSDQIHPNRQGVSVIVDSIVPFMLELIELMQNE